MHFYAVAAQQVHTEAACHVACETGGVAGDG